MRLESIVIQDFHSFQEEQAFDFTALAPGLYHVHGRNEVEPALEANGSGKSSLFEAPFWCFFGTTSSKLRAGAVKNWFSDHKCSVIAEVQVAVGHLAIMRQWNPNVLEVSVNGENPRPVDQAELETLLGMSPETYLFGIYHSQFGDRFLDLKPTEQMRVYSNVLELDHWEKAARLASTHAAQLQTELSALQQRKANLEGQAQSLVEVSYDKDEQYWVFTHAQSIKTCEKEIQQIKSVIDNLKTTRDKYAKGSTAFRDLRAQVEKQALVVAGHAQEERRLEQELAKLRPKNLKKCPMCGSAIDSKHIEKEIARLEKARKATEDLNGKALAAHDELMKKMVQHRDAEVKLIDAEKALAVQEHALENKTAMLKSVRAETNPYTQKRKELERRAAQLQTDLETVEKQIADKDRELKASEFWTKGFKEIRLMLIQESLDQLQLEANECLFQLGLQDWALEFEVERETKKGTIDRNFTVAVRAPDVKDLVPWGAWSGGESQRLRAAGTMGFSNLICSRLGLAPNVEFWDEPTAWISPKGIQDLLEILAERAQKQQKIILLADHKVLDSARFSGTICVTKTAQGSKIRQ